MRVNCARSTNLVKHILKLVLRQSRTLDILDCTQILGHLLAVFFLDRLHFLPCKLLSHTGIVSQIDLSANDKAGYARAMMVHLREPFLSHVFERRW